MIWLIEVESTFERWFYRVCKYLRLCFDNMSNFPLRFVFMEGQLWTAQKEFRRLQILYFQLLKLKNKHSRYIFTYKLILYTCILQLKSNFKGKSSLTTSFLILKNCSFLSFGFKNLRNIFTKFLIFTDLQLQKITISEQNAAIRIKILRRFHSQNTPGQKRAW